jgi:hypothetical protein
VTRDRDRPFWHTGAMAQEAARLQPHPILTHMRVTAGPLRWEAMAFGPGLTALIGLNGAGKTWALRGLRAALEGRALANGSALLFCNLPPGSEAFSWAQQQLVPEREKYSVWSPHKTAPYSSQDIEEDRARLREAALKWFREGGRGYEPDLCEARESGLLGQIADELSRAATFCLVPTGVDAVEWQLWLCAPVDLSKHPGVEVAKRQFLSHENNLLAMTERHEVAWDANDAELAAGAIDQAEYDRRSDEIMLEWTALGLDLYDEPIAGLLWQFRGDFTPDDAWAFMRPHLQGTTPLPLALLGSVRDIPFSLFDDRDGTDLDLLASTALDRSALAPGSSTAVDPSEVAIMRTWAGQLAKTASDLFALLLQDAPLLTLNVRPVGEWLVAPALHWSVVVDPTSSAEVAVEDLSQAEGRWARFAIRWALEALTLGRIPAVVVVDEPEAALHRSAEEHVARGLDALTVGGTQVVVATHSPLLIDEPTTALYEVRKTSGRSELCALASLEREALGRLGLRPSDLLRRHRVFVLVEGEHDEIVLRRLCGEQLREARAEIIAIRGGSKLPRTTDSQMLFDFTDAHAVAVLDNVDAQYVRRVWEEARCRESTSGREEAIDHIDEAFKNAPRKSAEYDWIATWLKRALARGLSSRLEPYGLRAQDIIEYLPVDVLVPGGGHDWQALRAEHALALPTQDKAKGLHDFKTWLTRVKGADTSVDNIRRAVEAVRDVPEEILHLGYRIREIGLRPRARG